MRTPLTIERLESRCVPALWGNPWPFAEHMSLSFVPDGTLVGAQASTLFQTLDDALPRATWQTEILRAFQTWAAEGNINIRLVSDSGDPLGTSGQLQGDTRFGDIRIAAVPLSDNVLALSQPFDVSASTWSGDLIINSNYLTADSAYDLFTIALHEAGHILGNEHSDDPESVMFESYLGERDGLADMDSAALQMFYGIRQHDIYDAADAVAELDIVRGVKYNAVAARGDVRDAGDVDVYELVTGKNGVDIDVRLAASNFSPLVSQLDILDAEGNVITSAVSFDPRANDLTLSFTANAKSTYYVRVAGGQAGAFGVGGYELQVLPAETDLDLSVDGPSHDKHNDNNPAGAISLMAPAFYDDANFERQFEYYQEGNLSDPNQVDTFVFASPRTDGSQVLTVMMWPTSDSELTLVPRLLDSSRQPLSTNVVVNENGTYIFQLEDATVSKVYFLEIAGDRAGEYFLGVDFGTRFVEFDEVITATVTPTQTPHALTHVDIEVSQLVHLVASADNSVEVRVIDDQDQVVLRWTVEAGTTTSRTAYLDPGHYRVVVASEVSEDVSVTLAYVRLSEEIDPYVIDPTLTARSPATQPPLAIPPHTEQTPATETTPPPATSTPPITSPAPIGPVQVASVSDTHTGVPGLPSGATDAVFQQPGAVRAPLAGLSATPTFTSVSGDARVPQFMPISMPQWWNAPTLPAPAGAAFSSTAAAINARAGDTHARPPEMSELSNPEPPDRSQPADVNARAVETAMSNMPATQSGHNAAAVESTCTRPVGPAQASSTFLAALGAGCLTLLLRFQLLRPRWRRMTVVVHEQA